MENIWENAWDNIVFRGDKEPDRITERRQDVVNFLDVQSKFLKEKTNDVLTINIVQLTKNSFKVYCKNVNKMDQQFICMIDISDLVNVAYNYYDHVFKHTELKNMIDIERFFIQTVETISLKIMDLYKEE